MNLPTRSLHQARALLPVRTSPSTRTHAPSGPAERKHDPIVTSASRSSDGPSTSGDDSVRTCRHCRQPFRPSENSPTACRYHTELFSGGEIAKYTGFVRADADDPEEQLIKKLGRYGVVRFWDCCGATEESAPGCVVGPHVAYGE